MIYTSLLDVGMFLGCHYLVVELNGIKWTKWSVHCASSPPSFLSIGLGALILYTESNVYNCSTMLLILLKRKGGGSWVQNPLDVCVNFFLIGNKTNLYRCVCKLTNKKTLLILLIKNKSTYRVTAQISNFFEPLLMDT